VGTLTRRLLGRKGTGWRPDEKDKRDWQFDRLGLSSSDLPLERNLFPSAASVVSQWSSNSCVGYSGAYNLAIVHYIATGEWLPLSGLDGYWYARFLRGWQKLDEGATIRDLCKAYQRRGVSEYTDWPFSYRTINKQPGPKANMNAYPRRGGSYVRIFGLGTTKADSVKAAIASGHPVQGGFAIDSTWYGDRGPEILVKPPKDSDVSGHHALCICAYRQDPDFGTVYGGPNSWGPSWRKDGWFWVTEDYLRSVHVSALTIYYGWT